MAQVSWDPATNSITPDTQLPGWVFNTKLVAKPDQLIKRRGKAGLLALNKTWEEAKEWIAQRAGKPQKVRAVTFPTRSVVPSPPAFPDAAPATPSARTLNPNEFSLWSVYVSSRLAPACLFPSLALPDFCQHRPVYSGHPCSVHVPSLSRSGRRPDAFSPITFSRDLITSAC